MNSIFTVATKFVINQTKGFLKYQRVKTFEGWYLKELYHKVEWYMLLLCSIWIYSVGYLEDSDMLSKSSENEEKVVGF